MPWSWTICIRGCFIGSPARSLHSVGHPIDQQYAQRYDLLPWAAAHRTIESVHWDAADYNIAFQLQTKDKVIVGYDLSICSREGNRTGMLVVNAAEEFVQHFVGDSIVTFRSDCNCSYAISMLIHFFNDCAVEDCARKVRSLKEVTYKRVIEIMIVCVIVFLCLSFAFLKTRYLWRWNKTINCQRRISISSSVSCFQSSKAFIIESQKIEETLATLTIF